MTLVTPDRTAPPLNAEPWSPLPEPMLGGLNVAWSRLGGTPVAIDETAAAYRSPLYDQLLIASATAFTSTAALPTELTVDLAGDRAGPGRRASSSSRSDSIPVSDTNPVTDFELQLSSDGQTCETVLTGD